MRREPYTGHERRFHKVYITQHTEYHVRSERVIAVRARGRKSWKDGHDAVEMDIVGHVVQGSMLPRLGAPRPGQRLYLAHGENDVVTSPVVAIVRPPKRTVREYPPIEFE